MAKPERSTLNNKQLVDVSAKNWILEKHQIPAILTCLMGIAAILFIYRSVVNLYFLSDAWGDMHYAKTNPLMYFIKDSYLGETGRHYRPLWRLSMWIQHILSGSEWYKPGITFTFITAWHVLASVGVFAVLRLLKCGKFASMAGMLFFALHPAVVEPVAWSAAESFLLAGMFGIWSVASAIYGFEYRKTGSYWFLPTLLAWCSLLSNEIGLGIPPLLMALWYVRKADTLFPVYEVTLRKLAFPAVFLGLLALYFSIRIFLFGAITNWHPGPSPEPVTRAVEQSDFVKFVSARLLWNYWPAWLDDKIALIDPSLYICMGLLVIGVLVYFWSKREVWACFALGIFFSAATWFPSHRVFLAEADPMGAYLDNSRVLYIAVMWWGVLAGLSLNAFRSTGLTAISRLASIGAIFFLFQYSVNTRANLKAWVDASSISRRFVETLPKCLPVAPTDKPIVLKGLSPFIIAPVEDMYTNKAYTFQVAADFMVKYIYKTHDVDVAFDQTVPGQVVVEAEKDGTARCSVAP